MIKKSILLLAAILSIVGKVEAQKCATDEVYNELRKLDSRVDQFQKILDDAWRGSNSMSKVTGSANKTTAGSADPWKDYPASRAKKVVIPVVVHIIHDYGTEYISDNDVFKMMVDLNKYYNAQNSDLSQVIDEFQPIIGSANIEFRLAQKDPVGNPTIGITRRRSYLTQGGDDQAKFDIWAPNRYLNIWLIRKIGRGVANGSVLAYATPPASGAVSPYSDGVISIASEVSNPLGGKGTIAHETGHFLNLAHPWNSSGKGASEACGDDDVEDTPPTKGHYGNPSGNCGNLYYIYDTNCTNLASPIPGGFEELSTDTTKVRSALVKGASAVAINNTLAYERMAALNMGNINAITSSKDGSRYYFASSNGKLYYVNAKTYKVTDSITIALKDITANNVSDRLFGISNNAVIRINTTTKAIDSIVIGNLAKIEENPSLNEVWVTGSSNTYVINYSGVSLVNTFTIPTGINSGDFGEIKFSKTGSFACKLANNSHILYRINTSSKIAVLTDTTSFGTVEGLEISTDGTKVYVSCPDSSKIYVYNANTFAKIDSIAVPDQPYLLYRHPDKSEFWGVNNLKGTVTAYSELTDTIVAHMEGTVNNTSVAFNLSPVTTVVNRVYANSPIWDNPNSVIATFDSSNYTMTKATTGAAISSAFVTLTTDSVTALNKLVPGRMVTGVMDPITFNAVKGTPYTYRTKKLTGFYQYQANGSDQGYISVVLTKWNKTTSTRDVIASVVSNLSGSVTSWKRFSIPLVYTSNTAKPDSAMIVLSASSANPANWAKGSYLKVDHLLLTDGEDGYYTINANKDTLEYPDVSNQQNIMDYADCEINFTKQQVMRMRAALNNTVANRNSLVTTLTQQVTGIGDTNTSSYVRNDLKPVPDFSIDRNLSNEGVYQCVGTQFSFRNQSWRDTVSSVTWEFDKGATPSTSSSLISVTPSFNETGWATVTLKAASNAGDSTISRKAVYVADNNVINPMNGYFQEFTNAEENNRWPIFNYYDNNFKWEIINTNGFYDKSCIVYKGYDNRTSVNGFVGAPAVANTAAQSKDRDDFFTPAFDLSSMKGGPVCNINFMAAGVWRSAISTSLNDTLEISYSTNCGTAWTTLTNLTGTDLATGTYADPFVPLSMIDWDLRSVNIPDAIRLSKVFFRFRYKPSSDERYITYPGIGNNYYIDRINVSPFPAGVNTLVNNDKNIALAPNPTHTNAYVIISNNINATATVTVTDITGKVVYRTQEVLQSNLSRVEIPQTAISARGMYMVQVIAGNDVKTEKLVSY